MWLKTVGLDLSIPILIYYYDNIEEIISTTYLDRVLEILLKILCVFI